MHVSRRGMRRQRGWAGLVMLLVVVLIVAFLAKDDGSGDGLTAHSESAK